MRYGVAAIEKMYPRQGQIHRSTSEGHHHGSRPFKGFRHSPIKMKPRPLGFDYEEIDARKILKPQSHHKYIREPEYDSVVYIKRREGLVPLSTLFGEDAATVLSSDVKLLKGRNVRLGKPQLFVKDSGRLVAVGGSRDLEGSRKGIRVLKTPKLVKIDNMEKMLPFKMDSEFAEFAASAIVDLPARFKRVDIRTLKRQKRLEALQHKDLKTVLAEENRSITNHLLEKLTNKVVDDDSDEKSDKKSAGKVKLSDLQPDHVEEPKTEVSESEADVKAESQDETTTDGKTETESDDNDESKDEDYGIGENSELRNSWEDPRTRGRMPIDISDDKPFVSQEFKLAMEAKRGTTVLSGVDACDVPDCFCKIESAYNTIAPTESTTPLNTSGSVTPKENHPSGQRSAAKNLKKVRRALKTLGVNFLHFDEEDENKEGENSAENKASCGKDFCQMGCVCEGLSGRTVPPIHCGKVDCMFHCSCSKDALKIATSGDGKPGRIGISAEGLRSSASLRRLAQEELKFSNTVVATGSGMDLLMIGSTAGRQRRERKVPSRYQDTDAFFDTTTGMPATSSQKAAMMMEGGYNEDSTIAPASALTPGSAAGTSSASARRMTQEGLKRDQIKKCTVIMPRLDVPDETSAWCLFHNVHGCPCSEYRNPLDYGPDVNRSRNVAKRSLGNNFKTAKRPFQPMLRRCVSENGTAASVTQASSTSGSDQVAQGAGPFYDPRYDHSARTFGNYKRKGGSRIKYPHTVVQVKKTPPAKTTNPGEKAKDQQIPVAPKLMIRSQPNDSYTDFGRITGVHSLKQVNPNVIKPTPTQ